MIELLSSYGLTAEILNEIIKVSDNIVRILTIIQERVPDMNVHIPKNAEVGLDKEGLDMITLGVVQLATANSLAIPIGQFNSIIFAVKNATSLLGEEHFNLANYLWVGRYHGSFLTLVNGDIHINYIELIFNNLGLNNLQRLIVDFNSLIDWPGSVNFRTVVPTTFVMDSTYIGHTDGVINTLQYRVEFSTNGPEWWNESGGPIVKYTPRLLIQE